MSYSVPLNLVVILSFIIFVFYILGIHNILTNLNKNECEMTYMFEFPQFVEISLPSNVQKAYQRYALFGYAEGGHTERLRKMKFKGIPVLFIPGSSGSHKQGRSLASVSLRKALNSRTPYYFDYFMVDLNEEQSAIYGGTLEDQTKFVRHCITKILSFYSKENGKSQTSVILIGHSLGGLIAKAVLTDSAFNKESIQLIIALAAPLKSPVIQPDTYIANFYKNIESCWTNKSRVNHITLVSIGGGERDVLVRSDLTQDNFGHVNVLSTAVPGVWCSTDHLSIVWCKQLVLTVVRALFDCVDLNTKRLISNHNDRLAVMQYHLIKRTAGKRFRPDQHPRFASFDKEAHWFENMLRQFSVVDHKGPQKNTYIMMRLYQDPTYGEKGENLSNITEIAPVAAASRLKRKYVYLNLLEYKAKNFTHVIVKVPRMDSFVQVNIDIHDENSRNINVSVPSMFSKEVIIQQTKENAVYYKINLNDFETVWQAFVLAVDTLSCKTAKNTAVVSFMVPWAHQDYHYYMYDRKSIFAKLAITSTRPQSWNGSLYPFIRLHLDPSCTYKVTIKSSLISSASQVVLYFSGVLPAYVVTVLLLTMRQQCLNLENGECAFFHSALCSAVRRYYLILQATILGSKLFGLGFFIHLLPKPDFFALEDLNMDYFFMSIMMYGVAVVIAYSLGIVCYVAVVMSGKAAHKMALKFIAKTITGFASWSDWIISFLHQVPILVSAMLVSLALSTSGALALVLGAIFYFLKICNMYEDYLDDIFHYSLTFIARKVKNITRSNPDQTTVNTSQEQPQESGIGEENKNSEGASEESKESDMSSVETKPSESESSLQESNKTVAVPQDEVKEVGLLSSIHFHVTIFLLWGLLTLLHTPSLLVWAKNYHYRVVLERDPAVIPSVILNICGAVIWQSGVPYCCKKFSKVLSATLFILAAISIIYASVSIYRLGYVISAGVAILTVNQLIEKFS